MFLTIGVYLLSLALIVAPFFALFSGNLLTSLLAIAAAIPTIYCIKDKKLRTSLSSSHALFLLLLLLLGIVSATWSIMPEESVKLALRLILLCLAGYSSIIFMDTYGKPHAIHCITIGNIIGLIAIVVELMTGGAISTLLHKNHVYQLSDLNKGATFLALSSMVTLVWLIEKRRWIVATITWVVVLTALLQLESLAAILAFVAMTFIFAFLKLMPKKGAYILLPVLLASLALTPVVMHTIKPEPIYQRFPNIPLSALHRLYIWEFASHKADERPILGWGMSATRYIEVKPGDIHNPLYFPMPVHPHNQMLQLRFDLGLPGMALFMLFIGSLILTIRRSELSPDIQAATIAAIIGYLITGGLGYSVWHNWWVSNGFIVALAFASIFQKQEATS